MRRRYVKLRSLGFSCSVMMPSDASAPHRAFNTELHSSGPVLILNITNSGTLTINISCTGGSGTAQPFVLSTGADAAFDPESSTPQPASPRTPSTRVYTPTESTPSVERRQWVWAAGHGPAPPSEPVTPCPESSQQHKRQRIDS
ncbi:hypothetical protein BD626DRAFT_637857 [Schizophyllum amplum]|uniref:Uncharacterized protein n=1 Tax=Schizophyllum amplum TaxID=97359 RepID=A0A550BS27_9AGAR|nr:hypothetical protein BD626DRAFT_637857 [Auriculariopsis ampla]